MKGKIHTKETREKISKKLSNREISFEGNYYLTSSDTYRL